MGFGEVKREYTYARQVQKNKIVDKLKEKGFEILKRDGKKSICPKLTGRGDANFTAGGKIEPYDLSNWKWIYARNNKDSYDILISLQTFNVDEKTGNTLMLMDRIGVYIHGIEGYDSKECFDKMIDTGIDLPVYEDKQYNEKMNKLLGIINDIATVTNRE